MDHCTRFPLPLGEKYTRNCFDTALRRPRTAREQASSSSSPSTTGMINHRPRYLDQARPRSNHQRGPLLPEGLDPTRIDERKDSTVSEGQHQETKRSWLHSSHPFLPSFHTLQGESLVIKGVKPRPNPTPRLAPGDWSPVTSRPGRRREARRTRSRSSTQEMRRRQAIFAGNQP